jgi:hypothetical protein
MMRFLALPFFMLWLTVWGQNRISKVKLPKELNEISGLEKFNDSVLIAINDSGNEPSIFFLDLKGRILKTTVVKNAPNRDWEDLTMDDKRNLYIADVGNNSGTNTTFSILKLPADEAFGSDSVACEIMLFTYPFGPTDRTPDCEALFWRNDTLHLLTKGTIKQHKKRLNQPSGLDLTYSSSEFLLSDSSSQQVAIEASNTIIPESFKSRKRGVKDLVTAADLKDTVLVVLTYSKLYTLGWTEKKQWSERKLDSARRTVRFRRLTQKEAVVVLNEKKIIVAAERHPFLGGPFLYTIHPK